MPTSRILAVMEYAHRCHNEAFSLNDIAKSTGQSKATLSRIIRTLVDAGYLIDLSGKYRSNLFFDIRIPASQQHMAKLDSVLDELVHASGLTVEVLAIKLPDLYWFDKRTHPALQIRVVAEAGMTRTLYELDAPARLFLAVQGVDFVKRELLPGFFHEGPAKQRLPVEEAIARIEATDPAGVVFDREGNINEIRRYAVAVHAPDGHFRYLLSIAELAVAYNDRPEHTRRIIQLLEDARDTLTAVP
jgi:DNA-binding IclR family transcriptional regulator